MGRLSFVWFLMIALPLAAQEGSELAELLDANDERFPRATTLREFTFPADHGPHPEYRNEWWYITGNLEGDSGRRFGFELTIFRFALAPTYEATGSAWRTNQIYIAHLALTDAANERFLVAERYSRGALGLAGAAAAPFRVWIDDWEIAERNEAGPRERWRIVAEDEDFALSLDLDALKAPVLNGDEGLSQKSDEPGNASYYYSITRLDTSGEVRLDGERFEVSGTSWLDREWSSSALADDQEGWDWFALQLDDGSELMYYNIRLDDGSRDPNSGGTLTDAAGLATKIGSDDVELDVLDAWSSPEGGRYPSRWRLRIPSRDIDVEVVPVMADQELFTTVRYWEGAVNVSGTAAGGPVRGVGYVELTGYARDLE